MSAADRPDLPPGACLALDAVANGVLLIAAPSVDKTAARGAEPQIVYVNAAFVALTGLRAQALIGANPLALLAPETDSEAVQSLRTALSDRSDYSGEMLIQVRDQATLWSRLTLRTMVAAGNNNAALLLLTVESIEKYKAVRASLRSSEARLDLAMEASELSMWEWNIPEDAVYYNDQWRHSIGIEPQQLVQRTELIERLMLPPDAPEILDQLEQHLRGNAAYFESEYELPTRCDGPKWFAARAKVVRRDAAGTPVRVIGVLRDVSRRRRMQHEAREVEQRWERAVRGTSDGLYDWDLLTGHMWYAARFREIIGYSEMEFPDTFSAFQSLLHREDGKSVLANIRAHLENRTLLDVRCRINIPAGGWIWCRLRGRAERDASGRPLRLAGSISDISAQIRAEEALSRSQHFYGTILDSLPLYIAYADHDERLVYANRRFQEFFDKSPIGAQAQRVAEATGDKRYIDIGESVRQSLGGVPVEAHGKFCDASGRSLDLDATFLPHRDETGAVQGCFLAVRDVTEQRQLEAELRQSQKMEAVGRLTGGIAHDFNNLLSVIVGNAQLLARAMRQSPRLLKQAETALKAAMRGAELTRRLLAFARQQVLEPRVVELNTLIVGMLELLRRSLTNEIDIRQALAVDVWPVKVDPGQLENTVLNLVINARDAMPEGGVIDIVTRNVTLAAGERAPGEEALRAGDYAVLEISDNGTGMSPDILKRVFEPFFTTKDVGKGSGLGLSMVYGFLKQSDGHVSITSAIGRGTTVHLYFPRTRAAIERASLSDNDAAEVHGSGETILVVEDNTEVRTTAVEVLSSLGYRPVEAANGSQALEQFVQHPEIVLVFSDVMLPGGLLGANLAAKLRERRPGLKVLLTTGYTESTIMHRGLLDGSLEVLSKPYKVEELARRVRAILDGREENRRVPA